MSDMAEKYTVTKSLIESYKFRHPSGMYWADITIDAHGNAGRIQIASDYGSWQNYWSHCGVPFKEFLVGLDIDYTAGKFECNKHFDLEINITNIKKYVLQTRREDMLTAGKARNIFNEIIEIDEDGVGDASGFYAAINNTWHLRNLYYDDGFDIITTIDPGFKAFWKNLWPVFTQELVTEKITS